MIADKMPKGDTTASDRIQDGVVIGLVLGFQGAIPLVVFPGNLQEKAIPARSLTKLGTADLGAEVALLFEDGDPARPLIVGRLVDPLRPDSGAGEAGGVVIADGNLLRLVAKERIELRVGKASLIMEADGRITLRGTDLVSHASRSNRIRGGSVNLN
jgi:Domain of unknown function (DUF6484)